MNFDGNFEGSDSENMLNRRLGLFIAKFVLLILPVFLILAFPAFVFITSSELCLIRDVDMLQRTSRQLVLYGTAYSDYKTKLKYWGICSRKPQIVALGTSRVMQFRSQFFNPLYSFYNAGGIISKMSDLLDFIERLPREGQPQVILLGLDQYFFNPKWDKNDETINTGDMSLDTDIDRIAIFRTKWKRLYKDYFDGKFRIKDILYASNNFIGLSAIVKSDGYRNDGSHMHGLRIKDPYNPRYNDDYKFADTFKRIEKGIRRFEYSAEIRKESLVELETFLKACKDRGIYVSAFLPSYAHEVYETMRSMGRKYLYMWKIYDSVLPIFKKYGFVVQDFSDLTVLGAGDDETIDGFHGSEKAYLRLWLKLQENDPYLQKFSEDPQLLSSFIDKAANPLLVFSEVR